MNLCKNVITWFLRKTKGFRMIYKTHCLKRLTHMTHEH